MTLQEIQNQALELPIRDRWRLVQSLLSSIQQETLVLSPQQTNVNSLADLNPWTQSLIGVVQFAPSHRGARPGGSAAIPPPPAAEPLLEAEPQDSVSRS